MPEAKPKRVSPGTRGKAPFIVEDVARQLPSKHGELAIYHVVAQLRKVFAPSASLGTLVAQMGTDPAEGLVDIAEKYATPGTILAGMISNAMGDP
ncbi:hypothetical protein N9L68_05355 [bacterium]|nr:hypothetical protein [bacterium]